MTPSLLLVAHGSRDPRAAVLIDELAAAVARRRPELEVAAAYLDHGRPTVDDVLARAERPVVVVPLLLARGWHERVDLPARLARARVPVRLTPPLGPHPALARALVDGLVAADAAPANETGVVVAAVGSRDARAAADVAAVAAGLHGWREVVVASVAAGDGPDAVARLRERGSTRVAIASYVLAPGLLPDRFADWGAEVVTPPLGARPAVVGIVLERYDAVAGSVPATGAPLPRPA